jgi:hypothetical protein
MKAIRKCFDIDFLLIVILQILFCLNHSRKHRVYFYVIFLLFSMCLLWFILFVMHLQFVKSQADMIRQTNVENNFEILLLKG